MPAIPRISLGSHLGMNYALSRELRRVDGALMPVAPILTLL
jgi:hypothetical protein